MEHIYCVRNLFKEYSGKRILEINELNIPKYEITTIIGPSGAGKSTLLSILNHIEKPTSGTIIFDGNEFPRKGDLDIKTRRLMAMIFQKPVIFNNSVFENIAYGLKLRKQPRTDIKEKVEDIAVIIGLRDKLKQNARTLSGGEAQRVAIARAMILKPRVLLMDEVTTNLDPANVGLIENLIKHANCDYKITIVLITHNMNQARRLSNNVIFLLNGKMVEYGDVNAILNEPNNQITRNFVNGDMIW